MQHQFGSIADSPPHTPAKENGRPNPPCQHMIASLCHRAGADNGTATQRPTRKVDSLSVPSPMMIALGAASAWTRRTRKSPSITGFCRR